VIHYDSQWEASVHSTATHRECSDGTCPAVHDTGDPALITVQGSAPTDPQARADLGDIPAHEAVAVFPCSLPDSHARKRR
jgi:hypothetical protein